MLQYKIPNLSGLAPGGVTFGKEREAFGKKSKGAFYRERCVSVADEKPARRRYE